MKARTTERRASRRAGILPLEVRSASRLSLGRRSVNASEFDMFFVPIVVVKLSTHLHVIADEDLQAFTGLPDETFRQALQGIEAEIPGTARAVSWRGADGRARRGRPAKLFVAMLSREPKPTCPPAVRLLHEAIARAIANIESQPLGPVQCIHPPGRA